LNFISFIDFEKFGSVNYLSILILKLYGYVADAKARSPSKALNELDYLIEFSSFLSVYNLFL